MTSTIEEALLTNRKNGKKSLVVYLTGGLDEHFESTVEEVSAAGADVIEIGIPFSDPVMDGPTIQQANDKALAAGATLLDGGGNAPQSWTPNTTFTANKNIVIDGTRPVITKIFSMLHSVCLIIHFFIIFLIIRNKNRVT